MASIEQDPARPRAHAQDVHHRPGAGDPLRAPSAPGSGSACTASPSSSSSWACSLLAQYWFSDQLALWGMHARIVTPQEAPQLHGAIDRLCAMADMPKPRVAIADTDMPNAFATGRSPKAAVVCATSGLLRRLDEPEVEAVLAHELSHVAHRDVAVMTIASSLGVLAGVLTRVMFYSTLFSGGGRSRTSRGGGTIVLYEMLIMLVSIVVYVISFLLTRALSRYRELAADRSGAILIGRPSLLASALIKITGDMGRIPTRDLRRAEPFNAFFFTPAIAQRHWAASGFQLGNLFSTHPTLERCGWPSCPSSRPSWARPPGSGAARHAARPNQAGPAQPRRPVLAALGGRHPPDLRRADPDRARRGLLDAAGRPVGGPGAGRDQPAVGHPGPADRGGAADAAAAAATGRQPPTAGPRWPPGPAPVPGPDASSGHSPGRGRAHPGRGHLRIPLAAACPTATSDDLVARVHLVNSTLARTTAGGLSCCVRCSRWCRLPTPTRQRPALLPGLSLQAGHLLPLRPGGARSKRDTELELRVRSMLGVDLPVEPDVSRWFPLWDLPVPSAGSRR